MNQLAQVWNIRDSNKPNTAAYIGRRRKNVSGKWGNPFVIGKPLTAEDVAKIQTRFKSTLGDDKPAAIEVGKSLNREQVIALHAHYLYWALKNKALDIFELLDNTHQGLLAKDVYCYCAPDACHGDTILWTAKAYAEVVNEHREWGEDLVIAHTIEVLERKIRVLDGVLH